MRKAEEGLGTNHKGNQDQVLSLSLLLTLHPLLPLIPHTPSGTGFIFYLLLCHMFQWNMSAFKPEEGERGCALWVQSKTVLGKDIAFLCSRLMDKERNKAGNIQGEGNYQLAETAPSL